LGLQRPRHFTAIPLPAAAQDDDESTDDALAPPCTPDVAGNTDTPASAVKEATAPAHDVDMASAAPPPTAPSTALINAPPAQPTRPAAEPHVATPAAAAPAGELVLAQRNACRVPILYGQRERNGRRTQAEMLKAEWESLAFYRDLKGDPVFEQFGSGEKGGRRYSTRLYLQSLLEGSKTG
jgi:hypothetical protein